MRPKNIPSGSDYCRDCELVKPLEEFPRTAGSYCKACYNIRTKNSPNYKLNARKNSLKKKYGITVEDYDELFKKQSGVCKICRRPETVKNKQHLAVDHDHKTGLVRGLLCHECNTGLGKFKDNTFILKEAIWYLEKSEVKLENKIRQMLLNNMEDN